MPGIRQMIHESTEFVISNLDGMSIPLTEEQKTAIFDALAVVMCRFQTIPLELTVRECYK